MTWKASLILLPILLLAGCGARSAELPQPLAKPSQALAAATQSTTAPVAPAPIPIIYVYPDRIRPLPQKTVDDLLATAARSAPARQGRRPWFIVVHQNAADGDRQFYRIMLYFSPDAQTPRVRTGRFLLLWWWTGKEPQLRDYVQASRPDHPYCENLEIPAVADLPFEWSHYAEDVSPELARWAELIDLARPMLEEGYELNERPPPFLIERGRKNQDLYGVATGSDEVGDQVTARWTPKGFVRYHKGTWFGSPWGDF